MNDYLELLRIRALLLDARARTLLQVVTDFREEMSDWLADTLLAQATRENDAAKAVVKEAQAILNNEPKPATAVINSTLRAHLGEGI